MVSLPSEATSSKTVASSDSLLNHPADTIVAERKHPWLAGLEIVGMNGVLLGIDRIIYSDKRLDSCDAEVYWRESYAQLLVLGPG